MKEVNQPNETAKELENLRVQSIRDAVKGQQEKQKETNNSQENSTKDEKKLDNDQKNDYIIDNQEDSSSELTENEEDLKAFIENTFQGDEVKLAKSYKESQRQYTKLQNELKKRDTTLSELSNVLENNPKLVELLDKASQGEDIESLLSTKQQESQDKPNTTVEAESKLSTTNDVSKEQLIEAGLVNESFLEKLTSQEQESVLRQAKIQYMETVLPQRIAEKSAQEYEKRIAELERQRSQKMEEDKNRRIVEERYDKGIETVVEKFGLDFANNEDHAALLEDINRLTANIGDPANPSVIHESAVEIATEQVLKSRGMFDNLRQERPNTTSTTTKPNINTEGFNKQTRTETKKQGNSLADKLAQKHAEEFERYQSRRAPKGRPNNN